MMTDSDATEADWKQSIRDAESSPTENSSLSKYTNLDPCCYGNILLEFHHQSNLCCAGGRHAHTSHLLVDFSSASLVVGYLLPLCHPSVFLPSHIIESPMGTFFLLPHHFSLFSLLLGERGDRKKRNERRDYASTEELVCLWANSPLQRAGEKGNKGSSSERERTETVSHPEKQLHTYCIPIILWVLCSNSNIKWQFLTFDRRPSLYRSVKYFSLWRNETLQLSIKPSWSALDKKNNKSQTRQSRRWR